MNNQIKPTYCSFEIAKLLKEKGFDVHCDSYFNNSEYVLTNVGNYNSKDQGKYKPHYSRPTNNVIIQWLRVNHSISISIITGNNAKGFIYFAQIAFVDKEDVFRIHTLKMDDYIKIENMGLAWNKVFESYEQAENESIFYILNNLL